MIKTNRRGHLIKKTGKMVYTNERGTRSDNRRCANTRLLTRIITYLSNKRTPKIRKEISLAITGEADNSRMTDALVWLVNHKLIKIMDYYKGSYLAKGYEIWK